MNNRRMTCSACCTFLFLFLGPAGAFSQTFPRAEDVQTLDGLMKAYYEVVSGPAGAPRQWERDRSLHHPEAQIVIINNREDGQPVANVMTLADFHDRSGGISERGFFEYEIHRETSRHGSNAHIWSTYEWRTDMDGPVGGQGVNSLQLFHDGERWWIMGWTFDGRNDAPAVPDEYLPRNR
jgi:hypothetical protein